MDVRKQTQGQDKAGGSQRWPDHKGSHRPGETLRFYSMCNRELLMVLENKSIFFFFNSFFFIVLLLREQEYLNQYFPKNFFIKID